jgi:hypothetical protein
MKIKNLLSLAAIAFILTTGCSKSDNTAVPVDEVEVLPPASTGPLSVFHKNTSNYQLYVYRYEDTTATWTKRIGSHFSTIAEATPTALGFTNPYVEDSGTNLFGIPSLYTATIGTNNVKTAKVNAPAVLQFYPSASGSKTGVVRVIKQDVVVTTKTGDTFKIGISGEGTYDENSKVIDLVVKFNDTAIGGLPEIKRTYKLSVDALTL